MADLDYSFVVVGGGAVGKSALTVRFIQEKFVEKYDPTIEDSYRKQVAIDDEAIMVEIFDTAGQEEYAALRDYHMKKGHGFIVVYALDSSSSFNNAKKLIPVIQRIKEDWPEIPIVIAANKCDLKKSDRQIKTSDGQGFADQYEAGFFETSAKTGENVAELVFDLVRRVKAWRKDHPELWAPSGGKKKSKCALI